MLRVLAFAASVRKGSMNRRLIEIAADIAREKGAAAASRPGRSAPAPGPSSPAAARPPAAAPAPRGAHNTAHSSPLRTPARCKVF